MAEMTIDEQFASLPGAVKETLLNIHLAVIDTSQDEKQAIEGCLMCIVEDVQPLGIPNLDMLPTLVEAVCLLVRGERMWAELMLAELTGEVRDD